MKKTILKTITLLFLIISCTKSPECSDQDAQYTAIQLAKELVCTEMAYKDYVRAEKIHLLVDKHRWENTLSNYKKEIQQEIHSTIQGIESEPSQYTKYISESISLFENLEPTLQAVRLENLNKDINKCFCKAELKFNSGKSLGINYSIQVLDNGESYIEIDLQE